MHAKVGDHIVIRGHNMGDRRRQCVIREVRGPDGGPPYRVQWDDTEHETLFFPGPDATLEQHTSASA